LKNQISDDQPEDNYDDFDDNFAEVEEEEEITSKDQPREKKTVENTRVDKF
jgi:hypothetical protein